MIVRAEALLRKFRRRFSRSAWMVRLLNLTLSDEPPTRPGLVMVQIDGLGFTQFERAMQKGNMPFLKRLLRREGYLNYRHYTGLPSNTPAVQGALFYGIKNCVPAFSYKDSQTGEVFNMFTPQSASAIEARLKEKGKPLLAGGSAYGNIFTGGAKEPHFCGAAMGWGSLLKAANPLGIPLTILLNFHIFVRAFFLVILELLLALWDGLLGIFLGKKVILELSFIPLRVMICVVLREVIAAGAKIDIARGLSVVQVNFAGYDEQAHHRGPAAAVSHWTLRGIDSAIEGMWRAAQMAHLRDYDFFVYSDHGQEETSSYFIDKGRSIHDAVNDIFKDKIASENWRTEFTHGASHWRADLLRAERRKNPLTDAVPEAPAGDKAPERAVVTAMGPVGHIYPPKPLSMDEKETFARQFVEKAGIPLVMMPDGPGKALAWTPQGKFILPEQGEKVMEPDHPFFKEVVRDLVELCHHPDAGAFLIFGWKPGPRSLTFPPENGSHAGPGREETSGFVLLPVDAPARPLEKNILTEDLREAAFKALGRSDSGPFCRIIRERPSRVLRVMTYNVHACLGRDGRVSPDRIARIIARHDPDVVALQELSTNEEAHQAEMIAKKMSMSFHFSAALSVKKGQRGNALFSKYAIRPIRNGTLPRLTSRMPVYEPRGALWVEIDVAGKKVQIVNTHLSLFPNEGMLQTEALLGDEWMGNSACQGPVILCGDFNAYPSSKIYKRLSGKLKDTQCELTGHCALNTLPSFYPFKLVDYIFVTPGIKTTKVEVPRTSLEKISSDHLPLIVEVELP